MAVDWKCCSVGISSRALEDLVYEDIRYGMSMDIGAIGSHWSQRGGFLLCHSLLALFLDIIISFTNRFIPFNASLCLKNGATDFSTNHKTIPAVWK